MTEHNGKNYIKLFIKENWPRFLMIFTVGIAFSIISINIATSNLTDYYNSEAKERLAAVKEKYGIDIPMLCLVTNCTMVIDKSDKENPIFLDFSKNQLDKILGANYVMDPKKGPPEDHNSLLPTPPKPHEFRSLTEGMYPMDGGNFNIIKVPSSEIEIIKNIDVLEDVKRDLLVRVIIIFLVFSVLSLLVLIQFERIVGRREKYKEVHNLEYTIQKELTESVHHELAGPLAVIEGNLNMFYKTLGSLLTSDQTNYKTQIENAIDSIKAVLKIMSNCKHIKYSNGAISINKIIDSSISSRILSSLNTVLINFKHKESLDEVAVKGKLSNGEIYNALNTLIINATEAEATKIDITAEVDEKYIDIIVKDNGIGVRDRNGKINPNQNIFKYGYSTKDKETTEPRDEGYIYKVIYAIFGGKHRTRSTRGAGLAINRNILKSHGGDLLLKSTNKNGSVFILRVPIKPRRKSMVEENVIK